jgi:hypothetical protein
MQNQITVAGKPLVLPDFGHAVSDKFSLVGCRRFVAAKAGLSPDAVEKKSMKEVKAMALAAGSTANQVLAWRKEYDVVENNFRKFSRTANALFSSDASYRQSWRPSFNKKGEAIGSVTTFRKEKSLAKSADARLELANTEIASLRALLAIRTALPA